MRFFKVLGIIILILVALFFIVGLFLPKKIMIEHDVIIKASPEHVFNHINNFELMELWSPWRDMDSTMEINYPDLKEGVGAIQEWTSESSMPAGSQTIVESVPNEKILISLAFENDVTADAWYLIEEVEEGTKVTWGFEEESSYPIGRYLSLIFVKPSMDKALSTGLTNLQVLCEKEPEVKWSNTPPELKDLTAQYAFIVKDSLMSMDSVGDVMGKWWAIMGSMAEQQGIEIAGAPYAVWWNWVEGEPIIFELGIPLASEPKGDDLISAGMTYEGKAVWATHYGWYDTSKPTYEAIEAFIAENNLTKAGNPVEIYSGDPMEVEDMSQLEFHIYIPVTAEEEIVE